MICFTIKTISFITILCHVPREAKTLRVNRFGVINGRHPHTIEFIDITLYPVVLSHIDLL